MPLLHSIIISLLSRLHYFHIFAALLICLLVYFFKLMKRKPSVYLSCFGFCTHFIPWRTESIKLIITVMLYCVIHSQRSQCHKVTDVLVLPCSNIFAQCFAIWNLFYLHIPAKKENWISSNKLYNSLLCTHYNLLLLIFYT